MNILISGAFGYVGGRTAQKFLFLGHKVWLGSRVQRMLPDWCKGAHVITFDWHNQEQLIKACEGMDAVVHAAGMNAADCAADPVAALEVNALATARFAEAAAHSNVKHFIYLSTAHVYGNPLKGNISETTCPVNLHPYAATHKAGEDAVLAAHRKNSIQGMVFRLSNAIGSPAHAAVNAWMLLVNDICRQAVTNKHIVLHSDGTQLRDFVGMNAVTEAVYRAVSITFPPSAETVFNLSGGRAMRVGEMAEWVAERYRVLTGETIMVTKRAVMPDIPEQTLNISNEKLKNADMWKEQDLENEIDQTLAFCFKNFSA